eukprot:Partr_v1_DN26716_c0_g1_i1_m9094 putative Mannosyltransferase putative
MTLMPVTSRKYRVRRNIIVSIFVVTLFLVTLAWTPSSFVSPFSSNTANLKSPDDDKSTEFPHQTDMSMEELLEYAAFKLPWVDMQAMPLIDWTLMMRRYASIFTKWESLAGDTEREVRYLSAMGDLNRHLFPWLRVFQSDPLAMKNAFIGRGIVMSVGNWQIKYALSNLKYLRWMGCDLPVEVFYAGDGDLEIGHREKLKLIPGVKLVNLADFIDLELVRMEGWATKPFSLFASSFQEALLMDADVLFLRDPETLFYEPIYRDVGTMFYADRSIYWNDSYQKWLKTFLPEPHSIKVLSSRWWKGTSLHEMESGVVVLDKRKRFLGLLATVMINVDKVRKEVYSNSWGDKETFWIGPEMIQEPYEFSSKPAGAIGPRNAENPKKICSPQLLHVDERGQPLWFNQWILKDRFEWEKGFAELDYWSMEPGKYEGRDHNEVCLEMESEDMVHKVRDRDRALLDKIREFWSVEAAS